MKSTSHKLKHSGKQLALYNQVHPDIKRSNQAGKFEFGVPCSMLKLSNDPNEPTVLIVRAGMMRRITSK